MALRKQITGGALSSREACTGAGIDLSPSFCQAWPPLPCCVAVGTGDTDCSSNIKKRKEEEVNEEKDLEKEERKMSGGS